jgi:hypothetical protein
MKERILREMIGGYIELLVVNIESVLFISIVLS